MQNSVAEGSKRIRFAKHKHLKRGVFCVMLVFISLAGCEKAPTWQELTEGDDKQDTNPPVKNDVPPPITETTPTQPQEPVVPPQPKPEEVIANFKSLKPHEVNDSEIKQLAELENGLDEFVALDLKLSQVSDAGLAELEHFSQLRELNLDGVNFSSNGMAAVARVTTLDTLSLKGAANSQTRQTSLYQGLQPLSKMLQLKDLDLSSNLRVTDGGLSSLRTLVNLERLMLTKTAVNDAQLAHLKDLVNLKQLDIAGTQITDAGFEHLAPLVNLESLHVSWTSIDGSGFKKIRHLKLKYLNAADTNFSQYGLNELRGSKSLEELHLHKATVSDLGCKWISQMRNLRTLKLPNNLQITSAGVSYFKSLKKLEVLSLQGNRNVGDQGVAMLKACTNLKELNLNGTSCTQQVADYLNELRRKKKAPLIKVSL